MLLTALTIVAVLAGVITALPPGWRMMAGSVLILLHFAAILTAVTIVPPPNGPSPYWSNQLWSRTTRPYLQLTVLNNGYHFYAPEPGPAALVWFRLEFADGESTWVRIPDHKTVGTHVERRRLGALATSLGQTIPPTSDFERLHQRRFEAGMKHSPPIPMADGPAENQYHEPPKYVLILVSSYVRRVVRTTEHPKGADSKVTGVKVYRVDYYNPPVQHFQAGRAPLDPTLYIAVLHGRIRRTGQDEGVEPGRRSGTSTTGRSPNAFRIRSCTGRCRSSRCPTTPTPPRRSGRAAARATPASGRARGGSSTTCASTPATRRIRSPSRETAERGLLAGPAVRVAGAGVAGLLVRAERPGDAGVHPHLHGRRAAVGAAGERAAAVVVLRRRTAGSTPRPATPCARRCRGCRRRPAGRRTSRRWFSDMDANGDGVVTRKEWKGANPDEFKNIDANNDGQITLEEANRYGRHVHIRMEVWQQNKEARSVWEHWGVDPAYTLDVGEPFFSHFYHLTTPAQREPRASAGAAGRGAVHTGRRHARHERAGVGDGAVLRPPGAGGAVRHGHDDGDRASVPDDRAVRLGAVGGPAAGELVAPAARLAGGRSAAEFAGDGGDAADAGPLLHHVLRRRREQAAGAAWWNGTAIWQTLTNYEFTPRPEAYTMVMRLADAEPLGVGADAHGGGMGDGGAGAVAAVLDLGPALAVAVDLRLGGDAHWHRADDGADGVQPVHGVHSVLIRAAGDGARGAGVGRRGHGATAAAGDGARRCGSRPACDTR